MSPGRTQTRVGSSKIQTGDRVMFRAVNDEWTLGVFLCVEAGQQSGPRYWVLADNDVRPHWFTEIVGAGNDSRQA